MAEVCPTCGSPLPEELVVWDLERRTFIGGGIAVYLSTTRSRVFDVIWLRRNGGGIKNGRELALMVYGSPTWQERNMIFYHLREIRTLLEPTGYTITLNTGNPRTGYRLVKTR